MANKNILNEKERENNGLDTQLRFHYQADWAIVYLLEKLLKEEEFVIFVEYHEDVICSNSTHLHDDVEFEFYQIKTTEANFTIDNLCKYEVGGNSIIGKMILGVENKLFKKNVKKLCLLTISDINFKTKIKILGDQCHFTNLEENEIKDILDRLTNELKIVDPIYQNILCFQKSELPFPSSQLSAKGKIAEFIQSKHGDVRSDISSIYRVLWDDLKIKYEYKIPFDQWNECVQKRGLNSEEVKKILATHISLDLSENLKKFIENYINKLSGDDLLTPIRINLINNYYTYLLVNRSPEIIKYLEEMRSKISIPSNILDLNEGRVKLEVRHKPPN
ncbi:dsDNA nuclease domain-containing protein [Acinetobacter pittii]|uniref:dsDNA nuclease domain-containing protein n=1 Tax=Acinetobacter pittii TaxID=48296 RepID=UPI00325FE04D